MSTAASSAPPCPACEATPPPPERRLRAVAAGIAAAAGLFAVYLFLARTRAVNSDGASQALQAWDMLGGNPLLRGWRLTDVSFYTTEIPEYLLAELVRGFGPDVVHVAAAATYTLAVVFAALLAKGAATGREGLLRVGLAAGIMLAPQLDAGTNVLLSSPDHIGTSVPVMAAWLILDRAPPRWRTPVITFVLLAWSVIADELVLVIAVLPLLAVCLVRAARAARGAGRDVRYEAALAAAAVAAAAAGMAVPRLIGAAGGFYVRPVDSGLASLSLITGHNLPLTGNGLLLLGGAYFPGLPPSARTWFVLLHLAGVALAAAGIGVTAWRFFRGEDRVPQLLLAGIVFNVAAYATGTHAAILANSREIAPVLPFAAALAGRQLGPRILAMRPAARLAILPALAVVLAGYVAGLTLELTAPEPPALNAPLAGWLTAHRLGTGLSGYWESNGVTLTSGGRAPVRPVIVSGGRLVPSTTNTDAQWYNPALSSADFIVLGPPLPGYPGFAARKEAIATFGQPWRTYRVGHYTILRWRENLLTALATAPAGREGHRGAR